LLSGAEETLRELGAGPVTVVRVPGAFELPAAARVLIEQGHDAVVALGAVVRGDTPHFDYVCNTASLALSQLSVAHRVGIGFGLVTTNTREQALARAGGAVGHYGVSAAFAAVEMALLHRSAHRSHA
jgi:6,7-dimethyl-8-ribityllumazine synthase